MLDCVGTDRYGGATDVASAVGDDHWIEVDRPQARVLDHRCGDPADEVGERVEITAVGGDGATGHGLLDELAGSRARHGCQSGGMVAEDTVVHPAEADRDEGPEPGIGGRHDADSHPW